MFHMYFSGGNCTWVADRIQTPSPLQIPSGVGSPFNEIYVEEADDKKGTLDVYCFCLYDVLEYGGTWTSYRFFDYTFFL